jgi:hypothetical protein
MGGVGSVDVAPMLGITFCIVVQAANRSKIEMQMIQRVNFIRLPFYPVCSPRRMAGETMH